METALVTGASGFIGSALISKLNQKGIRVRALLRSNSSLDNLKGLQYEKAQGDLRDPVGLVQAVKQVDYIFHLAGLVTAKTKEEFQRFNSDGTRNLARAAVGHAKNLKAFIYVSSLAAAGPAETLLHPLSEDMQPKPVSEYGRSKLDGEEAVVSELQGRFALAIVRPPLVYGPRDKAIFLIIQSVANRYMPVPLLLASGVDRNKYYSGIHVDDLCDGIIQAGTLPNLKKQFPSIFYLTSGEIFSYQQFLESIAASLGHELRTIGVNFKLVPWLVGLSRVWTSLTGRVPPLNWDKLHELRPNYWICSNQKAKQELGFNPKYDLKAGMAQSVAWYKGAGWL